MPHSRYPNISLPISKSIANRLLVLQARAGEALFAVDDSMPDDVRLLHAALSHLRETQEETLLNLNNCGTAMRFLTAYCALSGRKATLTGCSRMCERPIGQLVDALRMLGAQIEYTEREGFPPLRIQGVFQPATMVVSIEKPQSTQFVSALLLMGVEVETDCRSPYITMTQDLCQAYGKRPISIERDWSAAAFWYEWVALHHGGLVLLDLRADSLQGDRVVAELFAHLGVRTTYTDKGVLLERIADAILPATFAWDFAACPDLYPAVAIACEQLHVSLQATGTESLAIKESDRLRAVAEHRAYHDHRIAMALLAAGLPCDDTACVSKSYPQFVETLQGLCSVEIVVPRRGINDAGKGKKWALKHLITASSAEFVWMRDDDVTLLPPTIEAEQRRLCLARQAISDADLLILPLRMRAEHQPNLLERLQMAEYAAIQALTIRTAKRHRAVMCSGANLVVRRAAWLASYADLHPELAGGDDMFLLESFKRQGRKICMSEDERLTAFVAPIPTWRAFFRQRMRWAGKAPAYKDKDILRCGACITFLNVLQVLCPLIILLKFPFEYRLIRSREPNTAFWDAFLLELFYPYYMLICLFGGLLKGQRRQTF